MRLLEAGNPQAHYAEVAFDPEESREMVNRTGDPDAGDSYYMKRVPSVDDGDTDAIIEHDNGSKFYVNFADGHAYSADGEQLPQELIEQAQDLGLIPHGHAGDPDSLRQLIAEVEPLIGSPENVTLLEEE